MTCQQALLNIADWASVNVLSDWFDVGRAPVQKNVFMTRLSYDRLTPVVAFSAHITDCSSTSK